MSDIFFSYESEDRPRAKIIAEALKRNGYSVWWDQIIPPGKTWAQVIEEELDAAKCVIVLWSNKSVKSDWVSNEAAEGARRGILVPILIDDVKIPLGFRNIQAANLIDWQGTLPNQEFDILIKSVAEIVGGPKKDAQTEKREVGKKMEKPSNRNRLIIVVAIIAVIILFLTVYWINRPQLSVPPDPLLGVSNIFLEEKKSDFDPFQFSISNAGGGTLEWNINADKPWIIIFPLQGANYGDVLIRINTSDLRPGSENATIKFTSNGGNEIRKINLTILPLNNPTGWPRHSINEGSNWDIKKDDKGYNKGYSLGVSFINLKTKEVGLVLYRNGLQLELPKVLTVGETYNSRNNNISAYIEKINPPSVDEPSSSVELTNITIY